MTTGKVSPKCALTRTLYLLNKTSVHRSVTKECPNHDGNEAGKSGRYTVNRESLLMLNT